MYKIYPTLLDSFQRYLHSDDENALQELLDKINRVPFTSEAADKGTAFNELVDKAKTDNSLIHPDITLYEFTNRQGETQTFDFKSKVVSEFVEQFRGAASQVFVSGEIDTVYGKVYLYGFTDEIQEARIYDIKTTGNYTFPKFLHGWQHIVYPYCLTQNGVDCREFEYTITDFSNIYREEYFFNPDRDTVKLRNFLERFIEFLESSRHLITDKKIFGED